jgi:hypothetical protein
MYKYYGVIVSLIVAAFFVGMFCSKSITKIAPAKASDTDWASVDSIRKKVEAGDFQIDLKAMNAICIKRTYNGGNFCTYILYKNKDSTLSEQYYTCSEEKHKELAEQFKRQMDLNHD